MLPSLAESQLVLRWDPHALRVFVFGDVDVEASEKLLSSSSRHVDDAPFRRLILDFSQAGEPDEQALVVLHRGLTVLQGAGAEVFLLLPDPAWKRLATSAGLQPVAAWGLEERDVESFVRQAAVRSRRHLATINAQAEAPRRWRLGEWLADMLTAEG